jgi:hypothetical protein
MENALAIKEKEVVVSYLRQNEKYLNIFFFS